MIKPGDLVIISDKFRYYCQCDYNKNQLWPFGEFYDYVNLPTELKALIISVVTYRLSNYNFLITIYCLMTSLGVLYTIQKSCITKL